MAEKAPVLDASALLAFLFDEPGGAAVEQSLSGALISAVNWVEVCQRVVDAGEDLDTLADRLALRGVSIMPFDSRQAETTAHLKVGTREAGLSLADRACLALTKSLGGLALTADRAWQKLDIGVEVELVR